MSKYPPKFKAILCIAILSKIHFKEGSQTMETLITLCKSVNLQTPKQGGLG
jgi:hypothetical protein